MSVDEQSQGVNIQGEEVELASFFIHWPTICKHLDPKRLCLSEFDPGGKGLPDEALVLDVAMPVSTVHIHSVFDLLFVQSPNVPLFCALTQGFLRS